MFFWRTISELRTANETLRIELVAALKDKSHLEDQNKALKFENAHLLARVGTLEADEREIRMNLLRRSGVLPSEKQVDDKDREFKPVKKTVMPWSQVAAKAEADSKERYWKKQIELAERPQLERKQDQESDFNKDMQELDNVSSS